MEITPKTNINALLEAYPELETFLMRLNPTYKKLKNPILRRTVARIASLSQVAKIGGYDSVELVNLLRRELGQPPLGETEDTEEAPEEASREPRPDWLTGEAVMILDGSAMLDAQQNPLAEVRKALKKLDSGQTLRLDTDFLPAPLVDTFKKEGLPLWVEKDSDNAYHTWLLKR